MDCLNEHCQNEFEKMANACIKHKKAAVDLKEVCENQKKKLRDYRELNSKLYEDIDALESDIRDNDEFTSRLKKQRNDLENEVKYLIEKVEVKNEDIIKMDFASTKQKEMAIDVVRALEKENEELKENLKMEKMKMEVLENKIKDEFCKEKEKNQDVLYELKVLEEEVKTLQEINRSKEEAIKQVEEEKRVLCDEIESLKGELKFDASNGTSEAGTSKSLQDELEDCFMNKVLLTVFKCKSCGKEFLSKADLKKHMNDVHVREARLNLQNLQITLANQMETFSATINVLVKQEISKLKEPCSCKKFCNINHMKHNWTKIFSTEIISKFGEIKNGRRENGEV